MYLLTVRKRVCNYIYFYLQVQDKNNVSDVIMLVYNVVYMMGTH